ncbi:hypothetical protein [Kitasatospora sp. NPDC094016]|uniref:hypothetical protein n=1 Tax=Kitasatospora sp. NPDC094016 TaxID=3154986 RepID=UPI003333E22E
MLLLEQLKRAVPAVLLTACAVVGTVQPAGAVSNSVAAGSTPVHMSVFNSEQYGYVDGTLSWDGEGGYTFEGEAQARCRSLTTRLTAWLEYGGAGESWKQSNEADCRSVPNAAPVKVSGALSKGEKLELRVSTWCSGTVDPYRASRKETYTIS